MTYDIYSLLGYVLKKTKHNEKPKKDKIECKMCWKRRQGEEFTRQLSRLPSENPSAHPRAADQ